MSTYASNALVDGIGFMDMEIVCSPDPESTCFNALPTPSISSEPVETILNRFACSEPPYSEILSNQGSKTGRGGWLSALHIAAQKGHDRIARALLQHHAECNVKDSDGFTPLIYAVIGGYKDVVGVLLSHGARIEATDDQRRSALHWAVVHRREVLLKVLLECCARTRAPLDGYDNNGRTALHLAVETDFEAGVRLLLQFGANIHHKARKSTLET